MEMVVPTLPEAATYYLWPGLQDVGTTGMHPIDLSLLLA